MSARGIVISTVKLDPATIERVVEHSALGVRILENLRERFEQAVGIRSRIQTAEVFALLDDEIAAYREGTDPAAWGRP